MDNNKNQLDETKQEIMQATYDAIQQHGYAGLTIQSIADNFGKSKAVLHYHYDTKEDLLAAFLDYLLSEFGETIQIEGLSSPEEQLLSLVDLLLYGSDDTASEEIRQMQIALLEVQSQSPHKPLYCEQFTQIYHRLSDLFAEIIKRGMREGVFREVDADLTAQHILFIIVGGQLNQHTTNLETDPDKIRKIVTSQVLPSIKK
ncbi:TetR/AcrR family transcriptional regulator [Halorientalis persicus]|nr:TetR/AcrR family transcriptional regulator [Halorientalis persicus]